MRRFGAFLTTLKYDEAWDNLWRIGDLSDIVVTFEDPVRIVFWHGINYAASYVTENEIWMGDQSLESADGIKLMDLSKYREYNLNARQELAVGHLITRGRITNSAYQGLCPDVSPETLRRDFADLVKKGVLIKVGTKKSTYYILK